MTIEKQVCSLEMAKKLRELGVKQESIFKWVYWPGAPKDNIHATPQIVPQEDDLTRGNRATVAAAFTVAELGEMLLPMIPVPIRGIWQAPSPKDQTVRNLGKISDVSEADARAKMLIYLLENKLITL